MNKEKENEFKKTQEEKELLKKLKKEYKQKQKKNGK
jgi:hypothetical protein